MQPVSKTKPLNLLNNHSASTFCLNLTFLGTLYISGMIQHLPFVSYFTSHNIHIYYVSEFLSFKLNNTLLYVSTTFCLSVSSANGLWLFIHFWLLWILLLKPGSINLLIFKVQILHLPHKRFFCENQIR